MPEDQSPNPADDRERLEADSAAETSPPEPAEGEGPLAEDNGLGLTEENIAAEGLSPEEAWVIARRQAMREKDPDEDEQPPGAASQAPPAEEPIEEQPAEEPMEEQPAAQEAYAAGPADQPREEAAEEAAPPATRDTPRAAPARQQTARRGPWEVAAATPAQAGRVAGASGPGAPARGASPLSRLPIVQIALLVNTVVVALVVVILFRVFGGAPQGASALPQPPAAEELPAPAVAVAPAPAPADPPPASPQEPVSWREAEEAFRSGAYQAALHGYRQLGELSRAKPVDELLCDLFQVRIGQCLKHLGEAGEARKIFLDVSQSRSPIVRAAGSYQLALYDLADGQYLLARMRSYQAAAALASMDKRSPLEADCDFLIGQSLTEKALSFYNTDAVVTWRDRRHTDPFLALTEPALRKRLADGADRDAGAVLGPSVQRAVGAQPGARWRVACSQAPLEELLHRFADEAGLDVKWVDVAGQVRRRAVTLSFAAVSEQRLGEVACGMAGLLARFTGDQILIHNPQSVTSISAQKELLTGEAVSTWRRLFLRYPQDGRIPQGHFALACLHECLGATLEALREHQLVAHRFRRSSPVPQALLRSSKLRIQIRDYAGARSDLLDLLDRYPHSESYDQIYLYLGRATREEGLLDEAIRVFRRLYYLNLSLPSQMGACFGAARCFYAKGDYKETSKWLTRYVGLAKDNAGPELAEAHLLLGRCAAKLGNLTEATASFGRVLSSGPTRAQRVDAILETARAEVGKNRFVAAVDVLGGIDTDDLTPGQTYEYLLAFADIYRSIGLPEQALSVLRRGIEAVGDPQSRAALVVEMASCHDEMGQTKAAYKLLTEVLPRLKPSAVARRAACDLAEVCLKLNKTAQAVTIVRQLLKSSCPPPVRQRALEILGAAYVLGQDYKRAALAYSGLLVERPDKENK